MRKQPRLIDSALEQDDRPTPQALFDEWNARYNFTLDVAASAENAKCPRFFDVHDNGLIQGWGNETVWCNPPYSNVGDWVRKAVDASRSGATVVMLLPASTDTRWFHDCVVPYARVQFLRGRIKFEGQKWTAPFASMVCVFAPCGIMEHQPKDSG